jgi:hypothetical protein
MRIKAIAAFAALFTLSCFAAEAAPFTKPAGVSESFVQAGMGKYGATKFHKTGKKWNSDAPIKSKCIHPGQNCPHKKN